MKKTISVILSLSMILSMLCGISVYAEETAITVTAENYATTLKTATSGDFIITEDLTVGVDITSFTGTITGQQKEDGTYPVITLSRTSDYTSEKSGWIREAGSGTVISNLVITGALATTRKNSGMLIGIANGNITLENIVNSGNITGIQNVGGLIGLYQASADNVKLTIKNCKNTGAITTTTNNNAGGFIGYLNGSSYSSASSLIENCVNTGTVSVATTDAGGFIGQLTSYKCEIKKSANLGNITATGEDAGGIAGRAAEVAISECYNAGQISASKYSGGLFGRTSHSKGFIHSIENCYNAGKIIATANDYYAAGLTWELGNSNDTDAKIIKNNYNVGKISLPNLTDSSKKVSPIVFAIRGSRVEANLTNNYYLPYASDVNYKFGSSNMNQYMSTFPTDKTIASLGLDNNIWRAVDGGYPLLLNNLPAEAAAYKTATVNITGNGSVSKDAVTYIAGNEFSFEIIPDEGYEVAGIIVNGEEKEIAERYTNNSVTEDLVIDIAFKEESKVIEVTKDNYKTTLKTATSGDFIITEDLTVGVDISSFTGTITGQKKADGTYPVITLSRSSDYTSEKSGWIRHAASGTKISNLILAGSLTSTTARAGLLIGQAKGNITLENITNNGSVTAAQYAGGIIGDYLAGEDNVKLTVKNCVNNGAVTSNAGNIAGGIVGSVVSNSYSNASSLFENCINNGTVSATGKDAGGLSGQVNSYNCVISKCVNTGNVIATGEEAGGFAGRVAEIDLSESYNTGSVSASAYAGGFFGKTSHNKGFTHSIENCYNQGAITITTDCYNVAGFSWDFGNTNDTDSKTVKNTYNSGTINIPALTDETKKVSPTIYILGGERKDECLGNNYYKEYAEDVNYSWGSSSMNPYMSEFVNSEKVSQLGFNTEIWRGVEGGYPVLLNNLPPEAANYKLATVNVIGNGAVSQDTLTFIPGSEFEFEIIPDEGYQTAKVTVNGEEIVINDKCVIEDITDDIVIEVTFEVKPIVIPERIESVVTTFATFSDEFETEDGEIYNGPSGASFATVELLDGYDVEFGILFTENKDIAENETSFVVGGTDVIKAQANNAGEEGRFGIRFYGTGIKYSKTYYCRAYAIYSKEGEEPVTIYGTYNSFSIK